MIASCNLVGVPLVQACGWILAHDDLVKRSNVGFAERAVPVTGNISGESSGGLEADDLVRSPVLRYGAANQPGDELLSRLAANGVLLQDAIRLA